MLRERFLSKVLVAASGCHEWQGATFENGYGVFSIRGKAKRAHRVAHELFIGPIPAGMLVMHTCDNPCCVNPAHLVAGTQTDNMRDMVAKGRQLIVITDARKRPRSAYRTSKTGVAGVTKDARRGRWRVKVGNLYIGSFARESDAVAARLQAEERHYG